MATNWTQVLDTVGPRLRALRQEREVTLSALSKATGISVSTLSRLESGQRRPSLEQLLPIAQAHKVPLDELVGTNAAIDPRVPQQPFKRNGMTFVPLASDIGSIKTYKQVIPPGLHTVPKQRVHEGYEWVYVLSGKLRLVLGEHDLTLGVGEAAEFDTRTPHWMGNMGKRPVELINIFGGQGERIHVRARSRQ